MKTKITQFIEDLCADKQVGNAHCDISSSKVKIIHTPICTELYHQLEAISSEYNRDLHCLASDLLMLALEEAIEHIPMEAKINLDHIRHAQDVEDAELLKKQCEFNAGGT